jgi:peptidoglycan/LPS O-acetylase OafA/YrhL
MAARPWTTVSDPIHKAATRVNEIDLLRFIAALVVVFFHYSFRGYAADDMTIMPYPLLASVSKYGYLGVKLFFMISGFVILMTASGGSFRKFVTSRSIRLYPAFWVCCTSTFLVTLAIGGSRYTASIGQYLANMTMLSGFFKVPSIDGVYWTLFYEIHFYALVAGILAIGKIHLAQVFLLIWLLISVVFAIHPFSWTLGKLLMVDYSVFFIAGAACFLIYSKGISLTRVGMVVISYGLAMFLCINELHGLRNYYAVTMNNYIVAAIVTASFAIMILVALKKTGFLGRHRWLFLGSLTYPLYLLHQNIGYMIFNVAYPAINAHVVFWGTIIGIILYAYVVHIVFEKWCVTKLKAVSRRISHPV